MSPTSLYEWAITTYKVDRLKSFSSCPTAFSRGIKSQIAQPLPPNHKNMNATRSPLFNYADEFKIISQGADKQRNAILKTTPWAQPSNFVLFSESAIGPMKSVFRPATTRISSPRRIVRDTFFIPAQCPGQH